MTERPFGIKAEERLRRVLRWIAKTAPVVTIGHREIQPLTAWIDETAKRANEVLAKTSPEPEMHQLLRELYLMWLKRREDIERKRKTTKDEAVLRELSKEKRLLEDIMALIGVRFGYELKIDESIGGIRKVELDELGCLKE